MSQIDSVFVKLCREQFQFLVDAFDFRRMAASRAGIGTVIYTNSTTGVKLSYDRRDGYIGVDLIRLVNGKVPAYGERRDTRPLWTAVRLRAPGIETKVFSIGVLTEARIAAELAAIAAAVRNYAADILRGDFSVFPELERVRADDWQGGAARGSSAAAG
jgi:hypothetical protein